MITSGKTSSARMRHLRGIAAAACTAMLALLAAGTSHGAELFRWVDDQGVTHFGDKVPPRFADRATRLGVRIPPLTSSTQRPAPSAGPTASAAPPGARPAPAAPATAPRAPENLSCEEQMRRYRQSQECFMRFTNANGSKRPEAYQRCTELPEPQC